MSLETDLLLDRRRLKRRLVFWRSAAVVAVLVAILGGLRGSNIALSGARVARLSINGLITEDRKLVEALDAVAKDDQVKALIVTINSPGGSVGGGESLYTAIGRVGAAHKPVVAVMGGLAASAGYMVALPAERIFARDSTLTGSIGVLLETGNVSGLLDRVGIKADMIVSGALKGQPSFTHPLSPEGRDVLQGLVMDMYDQFVGMVAAGRHMDLPSVRALADGRAYTGRQALKLGLIDAIGTESDARAWLETAKGVSAHLPAEDVETRGLAQRTFASSFGSAVTLIENMLRSQSVKLDGAWALWQPSRL